MQLNTKRIAEQALERIVSGAVAVANELPPDKESHLLKLNHENGTYYNSPFRVDYSHISQVYSTGFLAGKFWLVYDLTRKRLFRDCASDLTRRLARSTKITTFDSGFAIYFSACLGHEITKDAKMKKMGLEAAETFMKLYFPEAGVFCTYPPSVNPPIDNKLYRKEHHTETIVDVGAALNLLWWAGRFESKFRESATQHQTTIDRLGLIRKDGSTNQCLNFSRNGVPRRLHTHQGYRNDSCWVRGLTWAMLSYATSYTSTAEQQFLDSAMRCIRFYLQKLPHDFIPYYDFGAPTGSRTARESCGAAIACVAMLMLNECVDLPKYGSVVAATLNELLKNYVTPAGLVLHSSWGELFSKWPSECIMPYGNYYFVEAIHRILKPRSRVWGLN